MTRKIYKERGFGKRPANTFKKIYFLWIINVYGLWKYIAAFIDMVICVIVWLQGELSSGALDFLLAWKLLNS